MSLSLGRLALSCALACCLVAPAHAQSAKPANAKPAAKAGAPVATAALASERARTSYMVGLDVGRSIAPVGPDLDVSAFERALRNGLAGGKPLLGEAEAKTLGTVVVQRIQARKDGKATAAPAISKDKVGLLVGSDVGRSLAPIASELDVPVLLGALKTVLTGGKPLLSETEADAVRTAFTDKLRARQQAQAQQAGTKNAAEGAAFLDKNRQVKGVFVTPSGLQYMVLRQGAGRRPLASDKVRVNYRGALLDGTVFDSSYERGQPAEFALNQVIKGWSEGVALMPVGAKYRFWIPGNLGYGASGTPGGPIGPNATLVFDVELLDIL